LRQLELLVFAQRQQLRKLDARLLVGLIGFGDALRELRILLQEALDGRVRWLRSNSNVFIASMRPPNSARGR
jgi:hypothetical protein